jgi:hypothetical protein
LAGCPIADTRTSKPMTESGLENDTAPRLVENGNAAKLAPSLY